MGEGFVLHNLIPLLVEILELPWWWPCLCHYWKLKPHPTQGNQPYWRTAVTIYNIIPSEKLRNAQNLCIMVIIIQKRKTSVDIECVKNLCAKLRWRRSSTSFPHFQTYKTRSSLQGWVNTTWRLSLSCVTVEPQLPNTAVIACKKQCVTKEVSAQMSLQ